MREAALFSSLPDPGAREQLVEMYRQLAAYLARRFAGRGEPLEDLLQVANVGLINAIDRFDPSRDVQFSTYATATIVGELKRYFRDKAWAIRVPRRLQEMALRINSVTVELWQEYGRSPTVAELARRTGFDEDDVIEAMEAVQAYSTSPLDAPTGEEGIAPSERLGDPDEAIELTEAWASVAPLIQQLPARDRHILYLRFFRDMTQSEIAEEVGISQMHVSRILGQTLRILRRGLGESTEGF